MERSDPWARPRNETDPEQQVTFLFSDIEASTRRWEIDPAGMATDLAHHDELLRSAIERVDGQIFGHTGDGMYAAFPTPATALAAAVAAQQALAGATWASTSRLRVRMAVHTGPAQRRGGNYFGPTLNRVARLMAVGSGGQVLCSEAAADLARGAGPLEVHLLDLGEHRLADLSRPERVFQVTHPAVPAEFPPLRSLGTHRHNLPVALSPFVGRADELKELVDLLGSSRVVTLIGVGGGGKTRLALQAGAAVLEHYPDGVWIVELAAVREGNLVAHAVATALGLDTTGLADAQTVEDHLVVNLRAKRALLIVDNCEHLVEPAARVIHTLLSRCPAVTVLATSREILGVPGEVAWRVPPLSLPSPDPGDPGELFGSDAVLLFCERARAARPGFELNGANAVDVARICRRLDGIPLALELAAARIRALSVHQVAQRLDDCFRLLTGGSRTAVARHQTLRAALDWNYELLEPVEQAVLARLAVFPSSFELEAAESVIVAADGTEPAAGGGHDALDLLSLLVDKSLVVVLGEDDADVRYRLLEPVRQYSAERLTRAGEDHATRRRHRDFFIALDDRWPRQVMGPPARLSRVYADQESFRAALEWSWAEGDTGASLQLAGALWHTWFWEGEPDACDWLERVLAEPEPALHPARVRALCGLATLLRGSGRGDPDRPAALMLEATRVCGQVGDRHLSADLDLSFAEEALGMGQTDRSRVLAENTLSVFEDMDNAAGVGFCHDFLGSVAVAEQGFARARVHFERAAELAREHDLGWVAAHALANLAPLTALFGDADHSVQLATEAVLAARPLPAPYMLVMALTRATETALLAVDHQRAVEFLTELLRLLRDLATRMWVSDALEMVALIQDARDDPEAAAETLGACGALRDAMGETGAGRVLAGEVRRGRDRLIAALGPDRFAEHEARGRQLSPETAVAEALAGLLHRSRSADASDGRPPPASRPSR